MKYKNYTAGVIGVGVFFLLLNNLHAQDKGVIYLGPLDLVPELSVDVTRDDNTFNEATGGVSSTLTLIKPSLDLIADDGVTKYNLKYTLSNGLYSGVNENNYIDHELQGDMDWQIDVRNLLRLSSKLGKGHQSRSNDTVSTLAAPDANEFNEETFSANYVFGSEGSQGRITLGFDTRSIRYTNNRSTTAVLDSDTDSLRVGLSVGFGPVIRTTVEAIKTKNTFPGASVNNRTDTSLLLGTEWSPVDVIKTSIKLGRSDNDLLNVTGDTSSSTGSLSLNWLPDDVTSLTFSAEKQVQNTENNRAPFVDQNAYSIAWNRRVSDNLNVNASVEQRNEEYVTTTRNDETNSLAIGASYNMRRWLVLGLRLNHEDRDSSDTVNNVDYKKNTLTFSISASL